MPVAVCLPAPTRVPQHGHNPADHRVYQVQCPRELPRLCVCCPLGPGHLPAARQPIGARVLDEPCGRHLTSPFFLSALLLHPFAFIRMGLYHLLFYFFIFTARIQLSYTFLQSPFAYAHASMTNAVFSFSFYSSSSYSSSSTSSTLYILL